MTQPLFDEGAPVHEGRRLSSPGLLREQTEPFVIQSSPAGTPIYE